ncbi:MAG TPA: hypothetical protein VI248_08515 [Kineosporiaceae bacterium]
MFGHHPDFAMISGARRALTYVTEHGRAAALGVLALAVVVAACVTQPAQATQPADAAVWNPGQVTYQVDASGCHTMQKASIDTATPEIATTISDGLDAKKIKDDYAPDSGVKVTQVSGIQKNGTHIDLTIDGWLSNSECQQSPSGPARQVSLDAGPAARASGRTHVVGTVDLTRPDRIALVAGSSWFKSAVKVVVAAAAWIAVAVVTLGVIGVLAAEGAPALALAAQAALAGCVGFAVADLLVARLAFPDAVATTKERIAVAVRGCVKGAWGGWSAYRVGPGLAAVVRRRLATEQAIIGQSGTDAANQSGTDLSGLASIVDGVAEGGLRAAQ